MTKKDEIFKSVLYPKKFSFNKEVANAFDDMILRSIPYYQHIIELGSSFTAYYYQKNSYVYDVGCSTGNIILKILESNPRIRFRIIGIDSSEDMIGQAKNKLAHYSQNHDISLKTEDAMLISYHNVSVIHLNFTLQFISVRNRLVLLKKMFDNLLPGGIIFISDKLRSKNTEFQETFTQIYEQFKEDKGYSRAEIERKKESLEQVLISFTLEEQLDLLHNVGFCDIEIVHKNLNFASLIAKKST